MKSTMPYLGVSLPKVRRAVRDALAAHPLEDARAWQAAVLRLWRDAAHREERYAAMGVAGSRASAPWRTLDALPMYEEMIVSGAWWDYVDEIASHLVGDLLRAEPEAMTATLRRWAHDPDPWRRRTSIIAQVHSRDGTDRTLLGEAIDASIDDPGFFLRKAIGWALRELSKHDPEWVLGFVGPRRDRLSGLSLREATRLLPPALREFPLDEGRSRSGRTPEGGYL